MSIRYQWVTDDWGQSHGVCQSVVSHDGFKTNFSLLSFQENFRRKKKPNTEKDVLWKLGSTDLWSWFYLAYDGYDLPKTAAHHAGGSCDWPPASCGWRRAQFCCHAVVRSLLKTGSSWTDGRAAPSLWFRLRTANNPAETFDLQPFLIMKMFWLSFKKAPSVWKKSSSVNMWCGFFSSSDERKMFFLWLRVKYLNVWPWQLVHSSRRQDEYDFW